jgi:hypothetical protein
MPTTRKPGTLPKPEDILPVVKAGGTVPDEGAERKFDATEDKENAGASQLYVHEKARQEAVSARIKNDQKQHWSWFIMACIAIMIGAQTSFIYAAGAGILDFKNYPWLLPIYFAQNFAQMVGLAYIVIKSIFTDKIEGL